MPFPQINVFVCNFPDALVSFFLEKSYDGELLAKKRHPIKDNPTDCLLNRVRRIFLLFCIKIMNIFVKLIKK